MPPEIKPTHLILMGAIGLGGYLVYKRVTAPPPVAPPPVAPPPAALMVSDIRVSPSAVALDQTVTIVMTVQNTGGTAGSATVTVTANGAEIHRFDTGSIDAGATENFSFDWTPTREGTFEVCAEVA